MNINFEPVCARCGTLEGERFYMLDKNAVGFQRWVHRPHCRACAKILIADVLIQELEVDWLREGF